MIGFLWRHKAASLYLAFCLLLVLWLCASVSSAGQDGEASHNRAVNREKRLFVWAGDQSRSNPDFLAVVNFDEHSAHYGEVVRTVPLPGPGATGNEPHHVGLSPDGKLLAAGGLLSVLKAQPEIFFFDGSHPDQARYISSVNPP